MSFWTNLRRFFCGWEKFETLDEMVENVHTINDLIDYAKQHFTYEKDVMPSDEWMEPRKAFLALQSPNTPADCEDFATVFDFWFKAKGVKSTLLAVWNATEGHAVCVYEEDDWTFYLDNWFRPRIRFASIQQVCFDISPDAKSAKIAKWSPQQKRFVYTETVNLKAA
jgi:predicted transglutaminase-like cysteine proteinase